MIKASHKPRGLPRAVNSAGFGFAVPGDARVTGAAISSRHLDDDAKSAGRAAASPKPRAK